MCHYRSIMLSAVLSVFLVACGPEGPTTDETRDAITNWRADFVAEITPGNGSWGNWMQTTYCSPGYWAIGYEMRVEGDKGSGDDTALNSVRLYCWNPTNGYAEWASSYDGLWGQWRGLANCAGGGNFLNGARMRIEAPISGDDTAANNAQFSCSAGGTVSAPGGMSWGDWGYWQFCPQGTVVCGLSTRFEPYQGSGDDTAMNGMRIECCSH